MAATWWSPGARSTSSSRSAATSCRGLARDPGRRALTTTSGSQAERWS
jgi:hypothetical protein